MGRRTRLDAVREANSQFGEGWMLPVALWLAAGGCLGLGGYTVAGVTGVFYAETAYGGVSGVVLLIRKMGAVVDKEKTEVWVPLEREENN